jgi:hypothetical protein
MRGVAVGALALLLLAGCSSSDDKGAAAPAPSTSAPVATACPAGPAMAVGATEVTSGPGDFDGDGRPDRLSTYRVAAGGAWRVRVELLGGGSAETELPATATGVKALGGVRLDVGPADAALAVVGSDAAGSNIGLFVLKSCALQRATVAGAPAEFPVRSSATARNGVACQAAGLVAYTATTTNNQTFQASSVSYLLEGSLLDEVHRNTQALAATDPALPSYGSLTCGTLKL